jgi:hypothetical protein
VSAVLVTRGLVSDRTELFGTLPHKRHDFRKIVEHKVYVLILPTTSARNVSHFNPYPANVENMMSS